MKVLCVIDGFGSGGAQRQIVNLAAGLSARGHSVEFFVYYPEYNFFRHEIDNLGIRVHEATTRGGFSVAVLWRLIRTVRAGNYDVAIAFLATPCIYLELARFFSPRTKIIASERNSFQDEPYSIGRVVRRVLHLAADRVVANSFTQGKWLTRFIWLRSRVAVVWNGYPIKEYRSIEAPKSAHDISIIGIGRVQPQKNLLSLIMGLADFYENFGWVPSVKWVGDTGERAGVNAYYEEVKCLLQGNPEVERRWEWVGESARVDEFLANSHLLVLPSIYEGLPNVICEAFIAGRPVLASNVCDNPYLVGMKQDRGSTFEPRDPRSISNAISWACNLSQRDWRHLGAASRAFAEQQLAIDRMVSEYEELMFACVYGTKFHKEDAKRTTNYV